ncbi:lipoprotein [Jeotgalibacillus aurantiacus]|uniref:lipoprotein n=1 Tax=Jeotgalibacillus aurantiacus TaxID=2763266 RepID=UPI001D0A6E1D|nr:lipoprotein [Jeotgalibacillus aurantiacus]
MKRPLSLFSLLFLLTGCTGSSSEEAVDYKLLASENQLTAEFAEIASGDHEEVDFSRYVFLAENDEEFNKAFSTLNYQEEIPDNNFSSNSVLIVALYESGCQAELMEIFREKEDPRLHVSVEEPDGDCKTIANPRSFIISLPKTETNDMEEVVLIDDGEESVISFN